MKKSETTRSPDRRSMEKWRARNMMFLLQGQNGMIGLKRKRANMKWRCHQKLLYPILRRIGSVTTRMLLPPLKSAESATEK